MNGADDTLLHPPAGWASGAFIANVSAELRAHPTAAGTAIILLVLLVAGRALVQVQARPRLRAAMVLLGIHVISIVARAELLSLGMAGAAYEWLSVAGVLALSFGIISVVALLSFDLVARRLGVPRIARDITTVIASAIVLVAVLHRSGVNLLQLVTTSAVVTIVIGLALQDTLGNIFAGVALQLDSAISIDDWVRIDEKVIGRVLEVRWRSTSLQTKDGDVVVFPNSVLSKSMVTRYNHGGLEHRQVIDFHADLRHPPNLVVETVLEALKDTPNVSRTTPPECLLQAFDECGARYIVRYRLVDYQTDTRTDSEVRKRIWYAFQRHELEMPWPTRTHLISQVRPEQETEKVQRDVRRRLRALAKIAFFAPLNDEERHHLAEGLRFLPFARGELILRQGEPGDSLYIVRDGRVSVRLAIEGSAKEIASLASGDFFGEMSLLTGEPRRASIVAVEDTECYVIDRALFEGIVQRNPALADAIGHLLAEREVDLQSQKHDLESSRRPTDPTALLTRIRHFFRLD